jgi:hypothetical protein
MIDEYSSDSTLEATEPLSLLGKADHPPVVLTVTSGRRRKKKKHAANPWYCGDCGARLAPDSTRGCCQHRDWRFGQIMPAELLPPLEWEELEDEEQFLVTGLICFPSGEAREMELVERLQWSSERLYAVAAPRMRQAAEFACCIYAGDTFRLTDQARDAFAAHTQRRQIRRP